MKRYLPDGRKVKVNRSQRASMEVGFESCRGSPMRSRLTAKGIGAGVLAVLSAVAASMNLKKKLAPAGMKGAR